MSDPVQVKITAVVVMRDGTTIPIRITGREDNHYSFRDGDSIQLRFPIERLEQIVKDAPVITTCECCHGSGVVKRDRT